MVKRAHEALAHTPERRVVHVAVITDVTQDAGASSFDIRLSDPKELYVVILKPHFALPQRLPVDHFVWLHQRLCLRAHVRRNPGVRRVSDYNGKALLTLYGTHRRSFIRE